MITMIYNILYSIKHNIYCPKETYIGKPICHWMHVSQNTCMKTWYIDTKYSKIILVVLEAQGGLKIDTWLVHLPARSKTRSIKVTISELGSFHSSILNIESAWLLLSFNMRTSIFRLRQLPPRFFCSKKLLMLLLFSFNSLTPGIH